MEFSCVIKENQVNIFSLGVIFPTGDYTLVYEYIQGNT